MSISLNKKFFISSFHYFKWNRQEEKTKQMKNELIMFPMGNASHYNLMIYGCGIFFSLPSIMWYCHTGNYRHGFWLFQRIFHHGNSQGGQTVGPRKWIFFVIDEKLRHRQEVKGNSIPLTLSFIIAVICREPIYVYSCCCYIVKSSGNIWVYSHYARMRFSMFVVLGNERANAQALLSPHLKRSCERK